jgi:hypothetical protein
MPYNQTDNIIMKVTRTAVIGLLLCCAFLLVACREAEPVLPTPILPASVKATAYTPATATNGSATAMTSITATSVTPSLPQLVLSPLSPFTYQTRKEFVADQEILSAALVDLTGGGLPDIVAATRGQRVYVFTLGGSGFHADYPAQVSLVAGGDMDGDSIGDVFLGRDDQTITAAEADMNTGAFITRQTQPVPGRVTAVSTISDNDQQTMLVGTDAGAVLALDLDLAQQWSVSLPDATAVTHLVPLLSVVPSSSVIVGYGNGQIVALNNAGEQMWSLTTSGSPTALVPMALDSSNNPGIIAGDETGLVLAADGQGHELWRWSADAPITTLITVENWGNDGPVVVVGSGNTVGQVTVLDKNGRLLWQTPIGYPPQAMVADDVDGDGRLNLIVGTSNGDLLILDSDGALQGRFTLPAPITDLMLANMDDTPRPELLAVAGSVIYLLDPVPATTLAELPPTPDAAQPTAVPTIQATTAPVTPTPLPQPRAHYEMLVDLDYSAHTAYVTQTVTVPNTTADSWSSLVFHAAPVYWSGVFDLVDTAVLTAGQPVTITPVITNTMIHLPLASPLLAGETTQIQFRYHLNLPRLDPLGWGPTGNAGWGPDLIQMGDWYPSLVPYDALAHRWRTWDYTPVGDPVRTDLADFSVQISASPDVVIAAPGYVATEGNTRRYELANGRAFAFLASPYYTLLEGYSQNTPVRVYVLNAHQSLATVVLNTAVQAINLYRGRFGPYPHDELIIAENGFLTAMEYSAIVSLSGYAFTEYNDSPRSLLTPITAHEVAHQYWYSAVGNDQVLEPWLDEALCMLAELLYYENYHPDDVEWWWQYRVHRWNPTGYVDNTIYDYGNSPDFVHDVYSQSAYFMRDLRDQMNPANFDNFLWAYYEQHRQQTVTTEDFFTLAQSYTTTDLKPLVARYFATMPTALTSP